MNESHESRQSFDLRAVIRLRLVAGLSLTTTVIAILTASTLLSVKDLSSEAATIIQLAFIPIAIALTAGSLLSVIYGAADMFALSGAQTLGRRVDPADWLAAVRALDAAIYRFLGKLFLAVAILLIPASRIDAVKAWFQLHPLLFFGLLVSTTLLFSTIDLLAAPYRRELARYTVAPSVRDQLGQILTELSGLSRRVRVLEQVITDTILPRPDEPPPEPKEDEPHATQPAAGPAH